MTVQDDVLMEIIEWWPEHGSGPLWLGRGKGGSPLETSALLDGELARRVGAWTAEYADDKLPIDGDGDESWIRAGVRLLADVRTALAGRYEVIVTEPWWGEPVSG